MITDEKIIRIETEPVKYVENGTVFQNRKSVVDTYRSEAEVTIAVVAYNRPDVTKVCVESVLKYTSDINYKLILVYNESSYGEGILDYFKSVEYDNKLIIHITENMGAPYAYHHVQKYVEGKYFVHLPNDVIVTKGWLKNLITCAESDDRIGMVNPVSSNVSNLQQVTLSFSSYEEMQRKAEEYNVSDPAKWHERIKLITLATLFRRECLEAVGDIFDSGFVHNFGDDDVSCRIRRAGYKLILAKDTWVHHDHTNNTRNAEEYLKSLQIGRNHFKDKYYGLDSWDDMKGFISGLLPEITVSGDGDKYSVLGVEVKCGTSLLEIRNRLREQGITNSECHAFTSDAKYYLDLQTVCGADNVVCSSCENVSDYFDKISFDFIIIQKNINEFTDPFRVIRSCYSILKTGGKMFVYLKNSFDVYSFLYSIGYTNMRSNISICQNIPIEEFIRQCLTDGMKTEIADVIRYDSIEDEILSEIDRRIGDLPSEAFNETKSRLLSDRYVFIIEKQ